MKKSVFLILLIAVFITAMSFAATISVWQPRSGDRWYAGQTYTILWTKSGSMSPFVKIKLMRIINHRTILAGKITDTTPNDGSYIWAVPTSLESGTYYISIKTTDNSVHGNSVHFTIINRDLDKKRALLSHHINFHIIITNPTASTTWFEGKRYNLVWNNSFTKGKHIKIGLYNFNGKSLIKVIYDGNDVLSDPADKSKSTYS